MIGSLWTGISGLAGAQIALDNESNNIANVNTIGFKASRISFADQMYQNNIGKGTQILDAEKMYIQGNLKTTGVNYDIAIAGDGFFAVANSSGGGTSETFYTRAGNFRMGDSGTLQDASGYEVQGWSMGSEPRVVSSNPNVSSFTNDYTKLLSSKIVQYSSSIETVTAKATDYTLTAVSDNADVFSGYGLKTKDGKIADVEELVKAYAAALESLKADPNSSSSSAKAQSSHLDLPGSTGVGGTFETGSMQIDGDEVYVWIDGNRISQAYISSEATGTLTAQEAGYIKTMKAFADEISNKPGLKAYVAVESPVGSGIYVPSTSDEDVLNGIIKIDSIIPGKPFTISSTGMFYKGGTDKPGIYGLDSEASAGKGVGALESIKAALNEAISGKQTDVYTLEDLATPDGTKDYSYGITIYDKGRNQTIPVPNNGGNPPQLVPITITNPADIDAFVTAINTDPSLKDYIKATNVNGALVIKTLDSNYDVEFSGDMRRTDVATELKRNATYSGREGAGAEFIEMVTRIDQTTSKGGLQLRLDTLGISDSAFGDFSVDSTGLITMSQDGAMFAVGQIAIAKFITNRGLEPVGNNLLKSTLASGDPIYNLNNDKTAELKGNTLELSTADLSESLVNLMVFQRAFEANSKSITTADTILNTLIQLKR